MTERIVKVAKHIPQKQVQSYTVKQIVDVPVSQIREKIGQVTQHIPQERTSDRVVEQNVNSPSPQIQEQTVEIATAILQERLQQRTQAHSNNTVNQEAEDYRDEKEVDKTKIETTSGLKNHCVMIRSTSTVKELMSKFEVGHTRETKEAVHLRARNRSDRNRWRKKQGFEAKQCPQDAQERADLTNQRQVPAIPSVQKTVEVPRVQYIDKEADIPVNMQRQVSTIQAAQDIDEVVDVLALTQSAVGTIPEDPCLNKTAGEDRLEHENKKRRLPMPAEAVSESRADESDFDRFDDLVLPSPEGNTLFMSIASDDETEDGAENKQTMARRLVQGEESMLVDETDEQSPARKMVQVVHAEWAQKLREVRKKFADDVASEITDVKNDLAHVRELLGVLVRRARCAETKAEIAARRLDRMERE